MPEAGSKLWPPVGGEVFQEAMKMDDVVYLESGGFLTAGKPMQGMK